MTKLLIVDDDRFIREGLVDLIDWAELGVEITGIAAGGDEALRMMEEQLPDILITDIQMPHGDGLELIAKVRAHNWSTPIIVLSGYNDYDYIRKAMKFQVEDYLLKPVDTDELTSIIKTICERKYTQWVNDQLKRESFQLLCNNVLLRWMENRIDSEQLREKLDFLSIDMQHYDLFQIAIITWLDWNEGKITLSEQQFRSFAIINSVDEALQAEGRGIAFPNQDREIVCLLTGSSRDYPESGLFSAENLQWLQAIATHHAPLFKTPWFCTVGEVAVGMQSVYRSYHSAHQLQDYIHLTDGPLCVDSSYIQKRQNTLMGDTINHEILITALIAGDSKVCLDAIAKGFQWVAAQDDALSAAKFTAAEWIVLIKLALKQKKLKQSNLFDQKPILSRLYASQDVGEIRMELIQLLSELEHDLTFSSSKKKHPVLEQVELYIHKSYMEQMSLQTLASLFNVNNVYLGRLFKEETDEYFNDYLTRVRLDKAQELLVTTYLKPSDIAGQIGFLDANYFFRKFKISTGITPMEYRSRHKE